MSVGTHEDKNRSSLKGLLLLVKELGTSNYREVLLQPDKRTISALGSLIQIVFDNHSNVSISKGDDKSLILTDSDVGALVSKQKLLASFENTFYWVCNGEQIRKWKTQFRKIVGPGEEKLSGQKATLVFKASSQITIGDLKLMWVLSDKDQDGMLTLSEFCTAKFLLHALKHSQPLPHQIPSSLADSVARGLKAQKTRPQHSAHERARGSNSSEKRPTSGAFVKIAPGATAGLWTVRPQQQAAYKKMFHDNQTPFSDGTFVTPAAAPAIFRKSGLDTRTLSKIWDLADTSKRGKLDETEFYIAMHLLSSAMKGYELPLCIPKEVKASFHSMAQGKAPIVIRGGQHYGETSPQPTFQPFSQPPTPANPHNPPSHPLPQVSPAQQPFAPFSQPPKRVTTHVRAPSGGGATVINPFVLEVNGVPNPFANPTDVPNPFTGGDHPKAKNIVPNPFLGDFNVRPLHPETDVIKNVANALLQQYQGQFPRAAPPQPAPLKVSPITIEGVTRFEELDIVREGKIGKGTFGAVWKGIVAGEIVAIKDMPFPSEKEVEMWKKEVILLAKLQHDDFLVQIKGYCISEKYLTIIMEIMDGGSLYEILHERKPVVWSMLQKVRILRHIARGLESIHQKLIVHRDIKSMNILLDNKGTAKLADLGCAGVIRDPNVIRTMGIGSPLWMAPEVNTGNYSFPSDIFSYGVVTYEVFNETLPDYDRKALCVIIPQGCIGYPVIKKCTELDANLRPSSHGLIEMMDSLITTFVTTVTRVIKMDYRGDAKTPPEGDVDAWYNILLPYDRDTFDTLLSTGLNCLPALDLPISNVHTLRNDDVFN